MSKNSVIVCLVLLVGNLTVLAQTPPPIPQPPGTNAGPTTQLGTSSVTFTNRSGAVYSVEQLAGDLQNLRAAVEQTLPALTAFTETYSNSVSGGQSGVAGRISGFLSGILNRNTNAAATGPGGAGQTNQLLTSLEGLLHHTNAPAATAAPANPNPIKDLATLQHYLQPTLEVLQRLNASGMGANQTSPEGLPPTGR